MNAIRDLFAEGLKAHKERRYVDSVALLTPFAEAGNADAQYILSDIYGHGNSEINTNDDLSFDWCKRSAAQGQVYGCANYYQSIDSAKDENELNILFNNDVEIPKTREEVLSELWQLADGENGEAYSWLTIFYITGVAGEPDIEKALDCLEKAYALEEEHSLTFKALIKANLGDEVESKYNPVQDLNLAIDQGCWIAKETLGEFYLCGNFVDRNVPLGIQLLKESAFEGSASAARKLGKCATNGTGIDRSEKEGVDWYLLAAERCDREAQFMLSQAHRYFPSVELPDDQRFHWLSESARRGYLPAMSHLGWGMALKKDNQEIARKGCHMIRHAAQLGDGDAQYRLGTLYRNGIALEQDDKKAVQWWKESAETGDPDGSYDYAYMLLYGIGIERDPDLAERYFLSAFAEGNVEAAIGLGFIEHHVRLNHVKALGYFEYAAKHLDGDQKDTANSLSKRVRLSLNDQGCQQGQNLAQQIEGSFLN